MRILLLAAIMLTHHILASEEKFTAKTYTSAAKKTLNYRIHLPEKMDAKKAYPLVIFLHGAGERGRDNLKQLKHGTKQLLEYSEKNQHNAIIIAPQCPNGKKWVDVPWNQLKHTMPKKPSENMQLVMELMEKSMKELPVDKSRIYITGLSMGGFGTWDYIQRQPALFAAAMPICGGGDTAEARKLTNLPIWAFHGSKDKVVFPSRTRDMIEAIKKAGGKPTYTELVGVGHNSWSPAYKNEAALKWLFSEKK